MEPRQMPRWGAHSEESHVVVRDCAPLREPLHRPQHRLQRRMTGDDDIEEDEDDEAAGSGGHKRCVARGSCRGSPHAQPRLIGWSY